MGAWVVSRRATTMKGTNKTMAVNDSLRGCAFINRCVLCFCFIWHVQSFSTPVVLRCVVYGNGAASGRHWILGSSTSDEVPVYDENASPPALAGLVFANKFFYNGDEYRAKIADPIRKKFFAKEKVQTVRDVFERWDTIEKLKGLSRCLWAEHEELCAYFRTAIDQRHLNRKPFGRPRPKLPLVVIGNHVRYKSENGLEEILESKVLGPVVIPSLEEKAEKLIVSGKINATALAELVEQSGGSAPLARHAADLTNLERPRLFSYRSEMLLQQLVYPPISGLFYSFNPEKYLADSKAYVAHIIEDDGEDMKPDAAIQATDFYVLGTMEITNFVVPSATDRKNCVKLTAMSVLALREAGVQAELMIPFVIGRRDRAYLYITLLERGKTKPEVKLLLGTDLSDGIFRAHFVACLAVLVSELYQTLKTQEGANAVSRLDQLSDLTSRPRSELDSQQEFSSAPRSSGKSFDRMSATVDRQVEQLARLVASCEGQVVDVEYAWREAQDVHSRDSRSRFGSGSFYFVGVRWDTREDVFIKVWLDDGKPRSQKVAQSEIDLQTLAHSHGVRCPAVVDHLTALFVDQGRAKFHRIVTSKLANDRIMDLDTYALSLIQTVLTLHAAGILHCDIKPTNVVWNESSKSVSIIDFGHAQLERKASSYVGTHKYTAPEIVYNKEPHSRITEAYSVGLTLLDEIYRRDVPPSRICSPHVIQVALKLKRVDPKERMTLEAASRLFDAQEKQFPALAKMHVRKESRG
jgi:Protein kinase domain